MVVVVVWIVVVAIGMIAGFAGGHSFLRTAVPFRVSGIVETVVIRVSGVLETVVVICVIHLVGFIMILLYIDIFFSFCS